MMLLGEVPPGGMFYNKPGPSHKARFMAFCLYIMKVLLFIQQLRALGVEIDDITVEGLVRLNIFLITVYIPYFLKASVGADAAYNDLALHKQLYAYIDIDGPIATAALEVLERHGWYTTEQTAPFSLFSSRVSEDEKARIAARILTNPFPDSIPLGPPKFQKIDHNMQLADLIGQESYVLFTVLGTDSDWLQLPPSQWQESEDYKEMEEFVRHVKVTNDVSERGVKLITDYAKILTTNNEKRMMLLQGVEMVRKLQPDFTKKTMNNNSRW